MKQILLGIAVMLLSAGCSTYRKYSRPEQIDTSGLYGVDIPDGDTVSIAAVPWRDFFADSFLQALIDSGLANNSDLRIASLRIEEAAATLSAARLAYLPAISLNAQGGISSFSGDKASKTYSLALSAEWEIDIAGKLTARKRAAMADFQQSRNYRQAVATQLIASIASYYYNLLMLDRQIEISGESLEAWDEIIRTLEARKLVGESHEAAVSQSRASRMDVENTIISLSQQVRTTENSLCTLLGSVPRHIDRGTLASQTFPEHLSLGVPLQLLDNRPDIRQAEFALQSAFYATDVAKAAFYPSLTLGGTIGWTNNSGAAIVNPGNWLLNAIGSLVQPIFNRGRNLADLRIARARQEEAVIEFQQKLLQAGAEVNEALSQWQNAHRRMEITKRQISELENAVRSTRLLMTYSNTASYLEVLTAQQTLLNAQLTQAQENFDRIQGVIKLYHALGGGE